jgi:hypothetical protein
MQLLCISSNITGWLARGMIRQLDTHWPQHPPVIVGGYDKPPLQEGIQFYKIGEWADYPVNRWSDGLIKFITDVAEDNFILTFDDFWLISDVPHNLVMELWKYFLLHPLPRLDLTDDRAKSGYAVFGGTLPWIDSYGYVQYARLCFTPPESPYTLSFQTGIWNKLALLKFLVPGETPGEAEIRGADRMSRARLTVAGTYDSPLRYLIVMQHGKLHFDDSGYQSEGTRLLPEDRAELERLGYLRP